MTLQAYHRYLIKNIWLIFGVALVVGVLAYFWSSSRQPQYEGVMTLAVVKTGTKLEADRYTYDDFYLLQSTALLVDVMSGWFSSPNITAQIFKRAELSLPFSSSKQLGKIFLYQKPGTSVGTLVVTIKTNSKDDTQRLLSATQVVIGERLAEYKKQTQFSNNFQVTFQEPLVLEQRTDPTMYALATGFATFLLASLWLIIRQYIRS